MANPVPQCSNCKFAVIGLDSHLECHAHVPLAFIHAISDQRRSAIGIWPDVEPTDWCGEYAK